MTSTENKPAPRDWFIQKPIAHNCPVGQSGPLNQIGAVFQVFRPTVALQGHEWVHVVEKSFFDQLQKELALEKERSRKLVGALTKIAANYDEEKTQSDLDYYDGTGKSEIAVNALAEIEER
jgi:hypothetical protein